MQIAERIYKRFRHLCASLSLSLSVYLQTAGYGPNFVRGIKIIKTSSLGLGLFGLKGLSVAIYCNS